MGKSLWLGIVVVCSQFMSGCGGSSGQSSLTSAQTAPLENTASPHNSSETLSLSGRVTYDYVPHTTDNGGLDFAHVQERPVRGLQVELLDDGEQTIAQTQTDPDGNYHFDVKPNQLVRVRVKAELQRLDAWDFKVTDNTQNNFLYALDGNLSTTGTTNSTRDLHAASGWDGSAYTNPRAAAPFAILDTIYEGVMDLLATGNFSSWPAMEFRWSPKNSVAEGDFSRGEIHTSFYDGAAIYLLGNAETDADEYDRHVILHEWAHYLERNFLRSDSLGGSHGPGEVLDIRVAMSEGFANAFAAMVLNDPRYDDASGRNQQSGFFFRIDQFDNGQNGYFNEGSISYILYKLYAEKLQQNMSTIIQTLASAAYKNSTAQTSIYTFKSALSTAFPSLLGPLTDLLLVQNIHGFDEYGVNEINSANSEFSLPIYKTLSEKNPVLVCSSSEFGRPNKLTNSSLISLDISESGHYRFSATNAPFKANAQGSGTKPEFIIFHQGEKVLAAKNMAENIISAEVDLDAGHYVVDVYDADNRNEKVLMPKTACFDFQYGLSGQ